MSKCARILSYLLFCYFAISLFVRYEWMRYGPSNKSPFVCVVSARWFGDQPAVSDQNRGSVDRGFWVPEGGGAKLPDIFHPDDFLIPALDEPIQKFLCRQGLLLRQRLLSFFGRWRRYRRQALKEVRRHSLHHGMLPEGSGANRKPVLLLHSGRVHPKPFSSKSTPSPSQQPTKMQYQRANASLLRLISARTDC